MWRHLSSLSGKFAEDASHYRTQFQASSVNWYSANWPGYEAAVTETKWKKRFLMASLLECKYSVCIHVLISYPEWKIWVRDYTRAAERLFHMFLAHWFDQSNTTKNCLKSRFLQFHCHTWVANSNLWMCQLICKDKDKDFWHCYWGQGKQLGQHRKIHKPPKPVRQKPLR